MGLFKTKPSDYTTQPIDDLVAVTLPKPVFDRFDPNILELGDVRAESVVRDALCAIFDLGGFTDFCGRFDPHLTVPQFLSLFLSWLFTQIRVESTYKASDETVSLYTQLPFFAKYLGDGVMFLWDTSVMDVDDLHNVPPTLQKVCRNYELEFLPFVRRKVPDPPATLRLGIARGRVLSIGNGADFVGPCINLASRLQKIAPGMSFCCSARGFDVEEHRPTEMKKVALKQVTVRGVGNNELVYILQKELAKAPDETRELFQDP